MQVLNIQGYTYGPSEVLLRKLDRSLVNSGGWIFDRRTLSSTTYEILLEFELRHVVDLYAAIIGAGLELTRANHMLLTDLCTCRLHPMAKREMNEIIGMIIEISFLNERASDTPSLVGCGVSELT